MYTALGYEHVVYEMSVLCNLIYEYHTIKTNFTGYDFLTLLYRTTVSPPGVVKSIWIRNSSFKTTWLA